MKGKSIFVCNNCESLRYWLVIESVDMVVCSCGHSLGVTCFACCIYIFDTSVMGGVSV